MQSSGCWPTFSSLVGVVFGFLAQGPLSLRAEYEGDVGRALERAAPAAPITDADLARLPDPVRRYLRVSGVVGRPRVHNFRVRMHGRIRSGPDARWMPLDRRAVQLRRSRGAPLLLERLDVHDSGPGIPPLRRAVGDDARQGGGARAASSMSRAAR